MTALRTTSIGLIGAGNMGQAIVAGLRRAGVPGARLLIVESRAAAASSVRRRWGVRAGSVEDVARRYDVIILAVKPQDLKPVVAAVRGALGARASRVLVISIAAGVRLSALQAGLGRAVAVVRVMPNLPATVGAGVTAIAAGRRATARHRKLAQAIFGCVGTTIEVPERCFDAVTAISGSGPAYFFLIFKALRDAGAAQGLPAEAAYHLAVQTALGSAQLAARSPEDPSVLIARVASKRGTTEAALKVLARRLPAVLAAGVAAAARRSEELSHVYSA